MRVTGLGHAGMFIETLGGSVLCDPWLNPAFFGSWFPFPDNRGLDWERFGECDYLYISHRRGDHFDRQHLARFVNRNAAVLLPEYPTGELERELRALGFNNIVYTRAGQSIERDGLRIMITPLHTPDDGPVGDSALSLDDGTAVLLNHNESHHLDIEHVRRFGGVNAYFTQVSGPIRWPLVYDLPKISRPGFAERNRALHSSRAQSLIETIDAKNVFPIAGPPSFLDDDLFEFNAIGTGETALLADQMTFIDGLRSSQPHRNGYLFLPGTVVEIHHDTVSVVENRYTDAEVNHMFHDKWTYLNEQRSARRSEIVAERATRAAVPKSADMFSELKDWWEPIMRRAPALSRGINAGVRFTIGELDVIADFPNAEFRLFNDESVAYWFDLPPDLVASNLARREIDWSNSIFLSLRFATDRLVHFNEKLFTFFKCLSEERIDHVENWFWAQGDIDESVRIDDWIVERCPHLKSDAAMTGRFDGPILTCSVHNWRFDLETRECRRDYRAAEKPLSPAVGIAPLAR